MIASVLAMIAEWILENVGHLGLKYLKDYEAKKQIEEKSKADEVILHNAKSVEEKVLAARKIADDSF